MSKKRIFMVQPSSAHTDVMPLPYAIGVLHAYVCKNKDITENFVFSEYIFEKKPIPEVVMEMDRPYAVFFSCYIWNYEYNKVLAKEIKKAYPETKLVFGGHSIPMDHKKAFRENPYADYVMLGEGERPFEDILLFFIGRKPLRELRNIAYLDDNNMPVCVLQPDYISEQIVSPYQLGLFDELVEKYRHQYRFSATLETNRGCPFGCAYCDWGLNKAKIRFAPEDQVLRDIAWISEHKIHSCYGADSNFGMFPMDLQFAQALCTAKQTSGYPKNFFVSFSKNSDENVLEISTKLHRADMLQGATLSFQSLNPSTLEAIGRKNLDSLYFTHMMQQYNNRRVPTYSELILGLPLETKESFKKGVGTLIACGQHSSIDVYECCLLPNSDLGQPESIAEYGIVSQRLPFRRFDVREDEEVQEYSEIIVQTSTMDKKDWRDCNLFSGVVSALHFGKLFHCIALYLHKEQGLLYEDIYSYVIDAWRKERGTVWAELLRKIDDRLDEIAEGRGNWFFNWDAQKICDESFKDAIYKTTIRNYNDYIELTERILLSLDVPEETAKQLVRFQAFCIKTRIDRDITRSEVFRYDFCEYFNALYLCEDAILKQCECRVTGESVLQSIFCE